MLFIICYAKTLFAIAAALFLTKCFKVHPRGFKHHHPHIGGCAGHRALDGGGIIGASSQVAPKGTCWMPKVHNCFCEGLSCSMAQHQTLREVVGMSPSLPGLGWPEQGNVREAILLLCATLVGPHLECCGQLCGHQHKEDMERVQSRP